MRKSLIQLLFIMALALQLTSCITTHQINYLQPLNNNTLTFKDTISYHDYCVKEGDRLFVQVYSTDEKTNALFNGSGNTGMQILSGSGENMDLYTYFNGTQIFRHKVN